MNDIISKMRNELRMILKASVEDYPTKPREKWLFDWPSQVILVVNQIFWCTEVEQAFKEMQRGDKDAMLKYNEFQVRTGAARRSLRAQNQPRWGGVWSSTSSSTQGMGARQWTWRARKQPRWGGTRKTRETV